MSVPPEVGEAITTLLRWAVREVRREQAANDLLAALEGMDFTSDPPREPLTLHVEGVTRTVPDTPMWGAIRGGSVLHRILWMEDLEIKWWCGGTAYPGRAAIIAMDEAELPVCKRCVTSGALR